eukprot:GHVR01016440.1.p1 GENE.GHVR01016440.1~~GHVR01016440.1.p1  ORF type:complete len:796 (+),score=76.11 GHVR01016440.1:51-2438(+)
MFLALDDKIELIVHRFTPPAKAPKEITEIIHSLHNIRPANIPINFEDLDSSDSSARTPMVSQNSSETSSVHHSVSQVPQATHAHITVNPVEVISNTPVEIVDPPADTTNDEETPSIQEESDQEDDDDGPPENRDHILIPQSRNVSIIDPLSDITRTTPPHMHTARGSPITITPAVSEDRTSIDLLRDMHSADVVITPSHERASTLTNFDEEPRSAATNQRFERHSPRLGQRQAYQPPNPEDPAQKGGLQGGNRNKLPESKQSVITHTSSSSSSSWGTEESDFKKCPELTHITHSNYQDRYQDPRYQRYIRVLKQEEMESQGSLLTVANIAPYTFEGSVRFKGEYMERHPYRPLGPALATRPMRLPFKHDINLHDFEFEKVNSRANCKIQDPEERKKFEELIQTGVLIEVNRQELKCLSPTDIIDSQGKKRVVTNFTSLNEECMHTKDYKKPEECNKIAQHLSKHGYRGAIDLKSAFFSIPVDEEHQQYLGTMIDGRYFKYAKMPMGLCCSPAYLDNRLKEIIPRRMGRCRIWVYMDDIGFWGPTLREVETVSKKLVGILQTHKFTVAAEKCHIGKEIIFAKLTVNDKGVSLTENKIDDIEQKFMEVLNSRQATKSGWASIRGLLNAHMTCLPTDATRVVRDITWLINKNNSVPWHRTSIALPIEMIPVIRDFLAVLRNDRIMSSVTHTPILIVDSSTEFWGGILHTGHGRHTINLQGPHTTQSKTRIGQNTLEAEAVKKGVEEAHKVLPFGHEKKGYSLKVYCDNMAVVAGITHPEKLNHKQTAFYNRIQASIAR